MLERFKNHLEQSQLILPGARVLVGYSGGADSTCLLDLLHQLGYDVVGAHLHHGQRAEADKELELCAAFCQESDIPFVSGKADVPKLASDRKMGLEEAGREARYGFFEKAAQQTGCDLIATAHTKDDLVEGILLNITRGSGISGLAGIPEQRGAIIRPLLILKRADTRAYCEEKGYWFHDDPANSDLAFSRARIRHRVVPELLKINPSADAAIARLAELAGEEDRFLNGMAAAALEQSELRINGQLEFLTKDIEIVFDRDRIGYVPVVLFRRAMRLAVEALGGQLDGHQTRVLAEQFANNERGSVTSEGGFVTVEWDSQILHVRQTKPTVPFRYGLTIPGETESEEFGWKFTGYVAEKSGSLPSRTALAVEIDRTKVKGNLYFRTPKSGDEMQPIGFGGRRKLADLMSDNKLTLSARARLPLVCDLIGPLWAPGICLDERCRVSDDAIEVLHLQFGPLVP